MSGVQKSNGMATASMVMGILSICLFFMSWVAIILGILAIVFSVVAKNKIKADPELAHTAGKAKGGMIMGIIGIVIVVIMIAVVAWLFTSVAGSDEFQNALRDIDLNELRDSH